MSFSSPFRSIELIAGEKQQTVKEASTKVEVKIFVLCFVFLFFSLSGSSVEQRLL